MAFPIAPFGGEHGGWTAVLLHCDGADGSTTATNNGQLASPAWAFFSNAQIDTGQSVFGGASAQFNGAADILFGSDDPVYALGTGDFNIDFRSRFAGVAADQTLMDFRPNATNGLYPCINFANTGDLVRVFVNNAVLISGGPLSATTWYHIAWTRAAGVSRLFLDGALLGSAADTNDYINGGGTRPWFGNSGFTNASGAAFVGHIDEIRIVKGRAMWTEAFTPPSAAYGHLW